METAQNLKEALIATREQAQGITLDLISRIMADVFDQAELQVLIDNLTALKNQE